jgi:DNA-binding transcriptional regulator YdaS (Cro superfamily)
MDIFDMHVYESRPAEKMEPAFRALSEAMRRQGGPRELWITEYGCYAEDDPSFLPFKMGDETMNQCLWPDERQATEQIVKFTAISFAYGMRKIFFHAGVCGAINNPNPGSVLFEYGGIPRKMYPGVAALTTLLGVPDRFVKQIDRDDLKGFVFQSNGHAVAIAWAAKGQTAALELQPGVQPYDIMGNKLKGGRLKLNSTPVYLTSNSGETIVRTLSGSK